MVKPTSESGRFSNATVYACSLDALDHLLVELDQRLLGV